MKKIRYRKLITPFLLVLFMIFVTQHMKIYAVEGGQDVPVSYEASGNNLARFQLQVIIVGNGSVFDGSQELRKQINVYELKYKEVKVFRLAPDKGHHIKSVVFQGVDITDQLNTIQEIEIQGLDGNSELIITYEKDEGNLMDVDSVNTGDDQRAYRFIGAILIAAIVMRTVIRKRRTT